MFFHILILPFLLLFSSQPSAQSTIQHAASSTLSCDNVPELNQKILSFVNSQMNKKVGRGECWDLAASALNSVGAAWDKNFVFGRPYDPKKECVYPGDVIQFNNVVVEYKEGNKIYKEVMDKHTAVIYEVKGEGDFVLADQNTSSHGKTVGLNPLNLKNISKGKYQLFRPTK